jgi:hypothetical protein
LGGYRDVFAVACSSENVERVLFHRKVPTAPSQAAIPFLSDLAHVHRRHGKY